MQALIEEVTPYVKTLFIEDARARRDKARRSEALRVDMAGVYAATVHLARPTDTADDACASFRICPPRGRGLERVWSCD
jgi:hypothetical protein